MKSRYSFFRRNGLATVLIVMFAAALVGQVYFGLQEYDDERGEENELPVSLGAYFPSGHFYQTTFENWESEFLQMGMYVLLTVWLGQLGSSESKDLEEPEEVDRQPDPSKKDAPWPVKQGGIVLAIYKNSLSIAFVLLFIISFCLHAKGSLANYNEEQQRKNKSKVEMREFLREFRFWFESFQNWQSEFVA